jgi:hypothetical protein
LEETLTAILETLRARRPSPFTRELLTEAERYQRVISGWIHRAPADAQRAAMFDCVLELRARVVGEDERSTPSTPSAAPPGGRRAAR